MGKAIVDGGLQQPRVFTAVANVARLKAVNGSLAPVIRRHVLPLAKEDNLQLVDMPKRNVAALRRTRHPVNTATCGQGVRAVSLYLDVLAGRMQLACKRGRKLEQRFAAGYDNVENAETHKKGKRNGRKNVTVFSMAMANVTGNPKRTIGTILTMGFSCVLFVIISNYVGNIDTEHEARLSVNHGQFELQLDYSAEYDERYPENNLDTILTDDPLNDSLIEEIKSIPGVRRLLIFRIRLILES